MTHIDYLLILTLLTLLFSDHMANQFKYLSKVISVQGPVAAGYGRGSKSLGFPTANLPYFDNQISKYNLDNGVYFGWAYLDSNEYSCVSNIGISPTFVGKENKIKIIESYLIDTPNFEDFYNRILSVYLIGYIRREEKFNSLNDLISQINSDVTLTKETLNNPNPTVERYNIIVTKLHFNQDLYDNIEIIDSDKNIKWGIKEVVT